MEQKHFTPKDIMQLFEGRVSYRQLQYWDNEKEIIVPNKKGRRQIRSYGLFHAYLLNVADELRLKPISQIDDHTTGLERMRIMKDVPSIQDMGYALKNLNKMRHIGTNFIPNSLVYFDRKMNLVDCVTSDMPINREEISGFESVVINKLYVVNSQSLHEKLEKFNKECQ